ncbi:zinc-dependent metalloprotease [Balneolaceae bacterium ANBcel3]|nr:zinc-dependent metalloprotease [Balneolaceae bacterium ANBcel3]
MFKLFPGILPVIGWFLLILSTSPFSFASDQDEPQALFYFSAHTSSAQTLADDGARGIEINRSLLEAGFYIGDPIIVDGRTYLVSGIDSFMENQYSVRAYEDNRPHSYITFTYSNGKLLGTIFKGTSEENKQIKPTGIRYKKAFDTVPDHVIVPINRDDELPPACTSELQTIPTDPERSSSVMKSSSRHRSSFSSFTPFDVERSIYQQSESGFSVPIDVMIMYTEEAREYAEERENLGSMDVLIGQMMNNSQLALDNSQAGIQLRVVKVYATDFQEDPEDMASDLRRITASSTFNPFDDEDDDDPTYAGYIEHIHDLRDDAGADLVSLLKIDNKMGGMAWTPVSFTRTPTPEYGFSVIRVQQAATSLTFIHELGHNLGLVHSRIQERSRASVFGGLFDYATGWRFEVSDTSYATVMAYREQENPSAQIPYFSDPFHEFKGHPLGSYHPPHGPSDNVRALKHTRHFITNFRPSIQDPPQWTVPTSPIEIIASDNGETELLLNISNAGESLLYWTANIAYSPSAIAKNLPDNSTISETGNIDRPPMYTGNPYLTLNDERIIFSEHSPDYRPEPLFSKKTANTASEAAYTDRRILFETDFSDYPAGTEYHIHDEWSAIPRDSSFTFSIAEPGYLQLSHNPMGDGVTYGVRSPFMGPLLPQKYSLSMRMRLDLPEEARFGVLIDQPTQNLPTAQILFTEENLQILNGRGSNMITIPDTWTSGEFFDFDMEIKPYEKVIRYYIDGSLVFEGDVFGGEAPETIQFLIANASEGFKADIDHVSVYALAPSSSPQFSFRRPSGAVLPGNSEDFHLRIFTDGLPPDTYEFDLEFSTNDPLASEVSIPVRLHVEQSTRADNLPDIPQTVQLEQNYPNPFNPATQIRFATPEETHVRLVVYTLLGQKVATLVDDVRSQGWHTIPFDASALSSGVYMYRLETDLRTKTRQMTLIK